MTKLKFWLLNSISFLRDLNFVILGQIFFCYLGKFNFDASPQPGPSKNQINEDSSDASSEEDSDEHSATDREQDKD